MKKYRMRKTLSKADVRLVCIENNYYTLGTCQEYEYLFLLLDSETSITRSNITTATLYDMAVDIKAHSETEDTVEDIMNCLARRITCSVFTKES